MSLVTALVTPLVNLTRTTISMATPLVNLTRTTMHTPTHTPMRTPIWTAKPTRKPIVGNCQPTETPIDQPTSAPVSIPISIADDDREDEYDPLICPSKNQVRDRRNRQTPTMDNRSPIANPRQTLVPICTSVSGANDDDELNDFVIGNQGEQKLRSPGKDCRLSVRLSSFGESCSSGTFESYRLNNLQICGQGTGLQLEHSRLVNTEPLCGGVISI
ncbi:MAG TPA: hypothetical protein DCS91_12435 [Microcoleaceae bacterium UBA11344]|nr:hypothetical protein [Microcoleaceae cyanobacterium UBA11344]